MGAQVSREPPPPLPGGYVVGEQVYFTGSSQYFESGERLEHGEQGVMGPAACENHKGKVVVVLFPGKGAASCQLNQACRPPLLSGPAHRCLSGSSS